MADAIKGYQAAPSPSLRKDRRDVIVLPKTVDNFERSRQALQQVMVAVQHQGATVAREFKHAIGFTASVTAEMERSLQASGYRVIEDAYVHLLPNRLPPFPQQRYDVPTEPEPKEGPSDFWSGQKLPYTGKGVTIAVLDSGIYPHPDLKGRIVAFTDIADGVRRPTDALGHGTHVAGDAAGNGILSGGKYHGLAPEANIAAVRVLDSEGGNRLSEVVDNIAGGLEWCVVNKERYNIKVANLSLGIPLVETETDYFGEPTALYDPIGEAINRAVEAGITVVAAAGNDGDDGEGSLNQSPAINPNVLTVGALDTGGTSDHRHDHVADFSSRGPTPDGRSKPDVLAPGVQVMAPNAPGSELSEMNENSEQIKAGIAGMNHQELTRLAYRLVMNGMAPYRLLKIPPEQLQRAIVASIKTMPTEGTLAGSAAYIGMDGTSMASPIVAGLVADMYEANPALSPQQVKDILRRTADPLRGESPYDQGAGVVNPQEALRVAEAT